MCISAVVSGYAQINYHGVDFVIGSIVNRPPEKTDCPLSISYYHDIPHPSRVIDVESQDKNSVEYNLHVLCKDTCSVPLFKTVKVRIPKNFQFSNCYYSRYESRFIFVKRTKIAMLMPVTISRLESFLGSYRKGKLKPIAVIVPAELNVDYEPMYYSNLCSSLKNDSILSEYSYAIRNQPRPRDDHYAGVIKEKDFVLYYENFNRRQKESVEKCYESLVHP